MRKQKTHQHRSSISVIILSCWIFPFVATTFADTFKQKTGNLVYHGYPTQTIVNGITTIMTTEKGKLELNLNEYDVTQDQQGRNKTVSLITIDGPIESEFITDSIQKSIVDESNKGPLLMVIELDSPGGRIDLAIRICSTLMQTTNCRTAAIIKSGTFGGAYSAATAVALACNNLYLTDGTAIGATTLVAQSPTGQIANLSDVIGKDASIKLHSAWKTFMASLAEKNRRPIAIVKGMEDNSIIILKVKRDDKIIYIEDTEKKEDDTVISTFKEKGDVVTLTAQQAVECGIADKVIASIQDVLSETNIRDAVIEQVNSMSAAKEDLEKIARKFNDMYASVVAKKGSLRTNGTPSQEQIRTLKDMLQDVNYLIKLKEKYPEIDLPKTTSYNMSHMSDYDPLVALKTEVERAYEDARMRQKEALKKSRPGMSPTGIQPQRQPGYRQ